MKTISLMLLLVLSSRAWPCDICGGVHANSSIGLLAANRFHTLGLSTQYRSYQSFEDGHLHSKEAFIVNSLQLRFQLSPQLQFYGRLPYQHGKQSIDGIQTAKKGLGEAQGILNYILLQRKDSVGITQQFVSAALGVKAPTGHFVSPSNLQQNLYPGTGSWDFSLLLNAYQQLHKKWGLQGELSQTWKGKNSFAFRYGATSQVSSVFVLNQKVKSYRLLSAAGLQLDYFAANSWDWEQLTESAQHRGQLFQTKMSCHLLTYNWLYSLQANVPLWQNINTGTLNFRPQIQFSIQYLIQQKKKS
jgi:hypothetical protein